MCLFLLNGFIYALGGISVVLLDLFMIAIGLSMDAFAVSLSKGLGMRKLNYQHAFIIAAFFGGFQALMPLLGWLLGKQFAEYIQSYDHWVAFILLSFIGGKMLFEAFKKEEGDFFKVYNILKIKEVFFLAVATSIDALAVGITFAFLQVSILPSIALIGITTFCLAFIGVIIGNQFAAKFENKAEIAGGLVLILIGLKILLQDLNIL